MKGLTQLTSLDLRRNRITDGSFLKGLTQLASLYLSHNRIKDIGWLTALSRMRTLGLRSNQIEELPPAILDIELEIESDRDSRAQSINVHDNPLKTPPPEIVEQGHAAIVAWFQDLAAAEEMPLNEVKLILVGDGGAGKTSLRKRLTGEKFALNEKQTHGIEIHPWKVECNKQPMLVHVWDFGGQEVMHATHQFFLTHRCLYLLVLDGRKEEDAEYWLKHIEAFGGASPVLVVLNKMDENPSFDVNRPDLLKKYPGIRDFFRVSCKKTRAGAYRS